MPRGSPAYIERMNTIAMVFAVVIATGQRPQLPDHWLTIDSLAQAVALTPAQREKVTGPYKALNAVLKEGATKRAQMRERMGMGAGGGAGAGGGGFRDMTDEQRQAMRARLDSLRAELQPLQDEADQYYQAIRAALTADQQPKFDALPKPMVMPQMRPRPSN
jgi:hypothetical protein